MMLPLILYLFLLLGITVKGKIGKKSEKNNYSDFDSFSLAGKNQLFFPVYFSLMTSMIGASATLGIADKVSQNGFSAFYWLCAGGIALILQSLLLSKKIKNIDAVTLADLASKTLSPAFGRLFAIIISLSWLGIIAAQFTSLTKLLSTISNGEYKIILIIVVLFVIFYSLIGGQSSVVKTNFFQGLIIFIAVISLAIWCFFNSEAFLIRDFSLSDRVKPLSIKEIITIFFLTGGSYFLGPDIISRTIISKDAKIARKATFFAGISLIFFSLLITYISLFGASLLFNSSSTEGINPLLFLMKDKVPYLLGIFLCLALFSALVSSVDICLVNAATIVEYDLLKKKSVNEIRLFIIIIGLLAFLLALFNIDIIDLMLKAYSIYSPAVVFPLLTGICTYNSKKYTPNKKLLAISIVLSASIGVFFPLAAMGLSFILSLISLLVKSRDEIR